MAKLTLFALTALLVNWSSAACTNPGQRRAWHTFTKEEKKEYINAELCLMKLPAKITQIHGVKTRFDDFQGIHQNQSYAVHNVGAFLPFHRLLMTAHETALRDECGYTGWQPYWYEQMDASNISASVVFDPVYGFGGNGAGANNCITDGPFVNYTQRLGPWYEVTDHCIDRNINNTAGRGSLQFEVNKCLETDNWLDAWACMEANPHAGGHGGVGGTMQNPVHSPGDPLFYLHHSFLDKVWWDWQSRNLTYRLTEMGGNNVADIFPGSPADPPVEISTVIPGDPGNVTTLDHVLNMYGNGPNRTIGDVMNIKGDVLCFEYVNP